MSLRLDDLQVNDLKMYQDDEEYCFGCDAVELANFVRGGARDRAVDLGAGNGIITILLAGKKGIKTTGVEISETQAALCEKNIVYNKLQGSASVLNMPMQRLPEVMVAGSATIVVCNPPYFKKGSGEMRLGNTAALARHEIAVTAEEVAATAAYLLSTGGNFYTVYPTERMAEFMSICRGKRLEPKEAVILNAPGKEPHLFLMRSVKDGKTGLKLTTREIRAYGIEPTDGRQ